MNARGNSKLARELEVNAGLKAQLALLEKIYRVMLDIRRAVREGDKKEGGK